MTIKWLKWSLPAGVAATLALSWFDVLPGAWRLHGIVLGEEGRQAWLRERHADRRLVEFRRERARVAEGSVVFLGASTVERFPLERCFPDKPTLDRGIHGDTVASLTARLESSLPERAPAGFVLAVGANDLRRERGRPAAIRDAYAVLLTRLASLQPGKPVALLGVHPTRDTTAREREGLERLNGALARIAREHGAAFVAADRPPLSSPDGRLAEEFSSDPVHLNLSGYRQLARWIAAEGGDVGALLSP